MKKLLKISALLMAIGVSSLASESMAVGPTSNFQTNAVINSSCVLTASNVAFGAYTPTATATSLSANGTINATCSNGVVYNLALDGGKGGIATRKMAGAASGNADFLFYNMYTTSAKTTIFGDGTTGGGSKITVTGNGNSQATTIYGSLLTNQYVTPDNYSDSLTVTMTY